MNITVKLKQTLASDVKLPFIFFAGRTAWYQFSTTIIGEYSHNHQQEDPCSHAGIKVPKEIKFAGDDKSAEQYQFSKYNKQPLHPK